MQRKTNIVKSDHRTYRTTEVNKFLCKPLTHIASRWIFLYDNVTYLKSLTFSALAWIT
jgi:hypothetical protein